jgi:hypothetical protein
MTWRDDVEFLRPLCDRPYSSSGPQFGPEFQPAEINSAHEKYPSHLSNRIIDKKFSYRIQPIRQSQNSAHKTITYLCIFSSLILHHIILSVAKFASAASIQQVLISIYSAAKMKLHKQKYEPTKNSI